MAKDLKFARSVLLVALEDAARVLREQRDEELRARLELDVARLSLRLLQVQEEIEAYDLD